MTSRDTLHRLVDSLPDSALSEAERYLLALETTDPVLRAALLAPYDDEPETDEERAGVLEARTEAARGELVDVEAYRAPVQEYHRRDEDSRRKDSPG
jgi:hypothetical protein